MPGKEVKVKLTGCKELSSAEVVECYYTSKQSFDCLCYYATAKADARFTWFQLSWRISILGLDFVTSYFSGHFKVL